LNAPHLFVKKVNETITWYLYHQSHSLELGMLSRKPTNISAEEAHLLTR
jgi:hypothetical protein